MQAVSQFAHAILICAYRKFPLGAAELQIITEVNGSYKDFISLTQSTMGMHQLKMQISCPKSALTKRSGKSGFTGSEKDICITQGKT